ncbi:VOC family protein [Zavarzinella formosa]|uniref:VOC family protein n=1 Tax=Zavarzinella formosa TaxID=360055 RepID=UPI00031DAD8A|nr:VOC family protein [Zavarzinella formosa]
MFYEAIDHLCYAPADPQLALKAVSQIGWNIVPWRGGWALSFGSAKNLFQIWVQSESTAPPGVLEFGIRVTDLAKVVDQLQKKGLSAQIIPWRNDQGHPVAEMAMLSTLKTAGVHLRLIEWKDSTKDRHQAIAGMGGFGNKFPAKRLDHLAVITHDLVTKSEFWENVLGIPRHGEIRTPSMLIRQYRIGDAIIELLGPVDDQSPLMKRTPGPAPMMSLEVPDLESSVKSALAAGFSAPAAADGVLPMTRTSTIPFSETGGLNWQLLQYV